MTALIWLFSMCCGALLAAAGFLHLLPRLGASGRSAAAWLTRAPGLDLWITYFTIAPPVVGAVVAGWLGVLVGVGAQIVSLLVWQTLHELANREAARGPRIVKTLNRNVGPFRNYAAVWWTAWAVPVFWLIRLGELLIYPPLTWLVRLPRYNHAEWVNVSRQKFSGLVGHDLIWCLYCDWMTGVWSLGSEMLRNVESFWCPIRFRSDKKCANCAIDFPDVHGGWVPAVGSIADAARVVDERYPPAGDPRRESLGIGRDNPWFGHPARLTVNGKGVATGSVRASEPAPPS